MRARRLQLRIAEAATRAATRVFRRKPRALPPAPTATPTGDFEFRIGTVPQVHDQQHTDHCCANAVAAAMETRVVGAQGGPPVVISAEHIFKQRPSRDLGSAVDSGADGAPDSAGTTRKARHRMLNAVSSEAMCELMRSTLEQKVPLVSAIQIWDNFRKFSGDGIYDPTASKAMDHAVCILGYGARGGARYWVAKNSAGAAWGDHGFVRLHWMDGDVAPETEVYAITRVEP